MTVKEYMSIKPEMRQAFIVSFGFVPPDILLFNISRLAERHHKLTGKKEGAA